MDPQKELFRNMLQNTWMTIAQGQKTKDEKMN